MLGVFATIDRTYNFAVAIGNNNQIFRKTSHRFARNSSTSLRNGVISRLAKMKFVTDFRIMEVLCGPSFSRALTICLLLGLAL